MQPLISIAINGEDPMSTFMFVVFVVMLPSKVEKSKTYSHPLGLSRHEPQNFRLWTMHDSLVEKLLKGFPKIGKNNAMSTRCSSVDII